MKQHNTTRFSVRVYFLVFGFVFVFLTSWGNHQTIWAQSGNARKGGELRIAMGNQPRHLNPAVQSGISTGIPGAQLFASLLRIDRHWDYHPYLAERWDVAKDGLSVTFHVRENATFHDGNPITSEDVAFSILAVKEHHPFSTMLAAVERVETPDPFTAIVRLKQLHPALLLVSASPMLPIIPKHIYGDGQDLKTHPANWNVVGSGPFQLKEVNDREIVLERYKNFFLPGKPYLDRIIFQNIKTGITSIAFEVGAIHFNGFNNNMALHEQMKEDENFFVDFDGYAGVGPIVWLAFNLRKPPFDDVRVRQALAYAIDRKFLVKTALGRGDLEATGPIAPGTPFYTDTVEQYDVNIKRANELLDEAGYPRNEKGIRFSTTIHPIPSQFMEFLNISSYLRTDLLRKIGVNLKMVTSGTLSDWANTVSNAEFSLAIDIVFNWGDPVIGVHRTYSSHNIRKGVIWSNTQAYRNPEVDALMKLAGTEMDFEKRKELYAKFQRVVAGDLPVYWLMMMPYASIYPRNLEGVNNSIWGTMFPFDEVRWKEQAGEK